MTILVCPSCHEVLNEHSSSYLCYGCGADFVVMGSLPILLVPKSYERFIGGANTWLKREIAQLNSKIEQLQSARWQPTSWDDQRIDLLEALHHNVAVLENLQSGAAPAFARLSPTGSTDSTIDPAAYFAFAPYLDRDWSRSPQHERQVQAIEAVLDEALTVSTHGGPLDSACFLGAGMARFAVDLAPRFKTVWLFDASITMGIAFSSIRNTVFDYYLIEQDNSMTAKDQIRLVTARANIESSDESPVKLKYAIADAVKLPLSSESLSVMLSVFFSDIVPLADILKEARRVLSPGGLFLHLGPLHYHFDTHTPEQMLPVDEIRHLLDRLGFSIIHEAWITTEHLGGSRLYQFQFRNWCFVARV